MMLIPMVLSLSVHEWAHAWSAYRLGDDTAALQGRLTLNPASHIDPFGTILLPLMGIPFGWAKPVPVNPARFRRDVHMGTGMALTAAAGPLSNVALAIGCAVVYGALFRFAPELVQAERGLQVFLGYGIALNVSLALFNLLPIPPLDGSRIAERFIPQGLRSMWDSLQRFGPLLLLVFFVAGRGVLAAPREALMGLMVKLASVVAGE